MSVKTICQQCNCVIDHISLVWTDTHDGNKKKHFCCLSKERVKEIQYSLLCLDRVCAPSESDNLKAGQTLDDNYLWH